MRLLWLCIWILFGGLIARLGRGDDLCWLLGEPRVGPTKLVRYSQLDFVRFAVGSCALKLGGIAIFLVGVTLGVHVVELLDVLVDLINRNQPTIVFVERTEHRLVLLPVNCKLLFYLQLIRLKKDWPILGLLGLIGRSFCDNF